MMHVHKRKNKSEPKITMCNRTMKVENLSRYMTNFRSKTTCPKCLAEIFTEKRR